MHIGGLRARQGPFRAHRICRRPMRRRAALPAAAHHGPHPRRNTMSARRRGAPPIRSGTPKTGWRSIPHDAEQRGIEDGDWVKLASRSGETTLARADHRPRRAGRRLHDVPSSQHAGQRRHVGVFRLGDELPRIQGDGGAGVALQRPDRLAARLRAPQRREPPRLSKPQNEGPAPRRVARRRLERHACRSRRKRRSPSPTAA